MGPSILKALTGKQLSFSTEYGTAYLGWFIFITRLFPILSFDLISYGAGITGLSFPVYASATLFGMIPSTLLLTYVGGHFQLSCGAIAGLSLLLVGLLVGILIALHRFQCLRLNRLVNWH